LLEQAPEIFRRYPGALLVFAGPCTDEPYGNQIQKTVDSLGLQGRVLQTGVLPPNDPRVIGLLQLAAALVLPSLSETFGLVILEAWAAGAPVLATRTSGPAALVEHGINGWFFDLDEPRTFHEALSHTLDRPEEAKKMAQRGALVSEEYGVESLANRVKLLYEELIEEKRCAT
jgi:glycosyltransferase involved in cell wall biosynthesis